MNKKKSSSKPARGSAFSPRRGAQAKTIIKGRKTNLQEAPAPREILPPEFSPSREKSFHIVGIGASAGGLEAFTQLLEKLPANTGMAFVLVQHLAPKHESLLTELLSRATRMLVKEVTDGMPVESDRVYVIPPNTDMAIVQGVLRLMPRSEGHGQPHMPIDHFLRSLAEDQRSKAIGVILSGTASDGALGLKAIKVEGGITFAQDEATAKYHGMPRSAIAAGYVDFILPPREIASELARIGRHPYVNRVKPEKVEELLADDESNFNRILHLLRRATGVDFNYYKPTTIQRRIMRRMVLHKIDELKNYVPYLQNDAKELDALYNDILINVTGFFRDPEAFQSLSERVFPNILRNLGSGDSIRIWVPGCSTGEEPYSIVIALLEFLGERATNTPIQIFATDISDMAIEKARAGVYEEGEILQFRGRTGFYLEPAAGEASLNVLRMAREGLMFDLRTAIHMARKEGTRVRKEGVSVRFNGQMREILLEVIPIKSPQSKECFFLVLFVEAQRQATPESKKSNLQPRKPDKERSRAQELELSRLKADLRVTKDYLQSIIEEQDATNEELRSANEEIQSSNEELQSTNEELETAKEELQSTNEELTTVNEELENRNIELSQVNDDLINLFANVHIPIIMLGNDLRLRRLTPMAEKVMNVIPTDVGRGFAQRNRRTQDNRGQVSPSVGSSTGCHRHLRLRGPHRAGQQPGGKNVWLQPGRINRSAGGNALTRAFSRKVPIAPQQLPCRPSPAAHGHQSGAVWSP